MLAPGHSMLYPAENLEAMRAAWMKYGAYKLREVPRKG